MPLFPSISKSDRVVQVLAKFNTGVEKPLMQMHEILMRSDDSPLTIAQRELIAAYVSGIAGCNYCSGSHLLVAQKFGIKEGLFAELLEDIDKASIDDKMKPILKYVKKLTLEPTKMIQNDIDAVLEAGWSERGLYDAMMICCTFNFMNRFVEGLGLDYSPEQSNESAEMLMGGYDKVIERFGLK